MSLRKLSQSYLKNQGNCLSFSVRIPFVKTFFVEQKKILSFSLSPSHSLLAQGLFEWGHS